MSQKSLKQCYVELGDVYVCVRTNLCWAALRPLEERLPSSTISSYVGAVIKHNLCIMIGTCEAAPIRSKQTYAMLLLPDSQIFYVPLSKLHSEKYFKKAF